MKYFYAIHIQASEKDDVYFHILSELTELEDGKTTQLVNELTAEKIKQNSVFIDFSKRGKFKKIMADYIVYQTDEDISQIEGAFLNGDSALFEKLLKSLVESNQATRITTGEIELTAKANTKATPSANSKKKKTSKITYFLIGGAAILFLLIGVGIGSQIGGGSVSESISDSENEVDLEVDGFVLPESPEFKRNAELLTVSIDRSYSPIPREDIQLQGEIIDGVAVITLPRFDRNEFFVHVPGHTWGFTTDPEGTRIQYHGGLTYEFSENTKLYRVLVKYGGGNGTKASPYIINYYDQLQLMAEDEARGYFRQTEDLKFPESCNHTPINTINELKRTPDLEHFEYDGGGYMIEGLNAPLFGTVSGSVIKNVNIISSNIETTKHENLGFIVNEAFNYRYEVHGVTYETGETKIVNSTVSHSTINARYPTVDENGNPLPEVIPDEPSPVIPPDMELSDEEIETLYNIPVSTQGEYAIGGITGLGGQIENCYVSDVTIFTDLHGNFLYGGGISGKPANVVNSGVNSLSIEGNIFHAGGIAGSAGGSRLYGADGRELPIFYGGNIQGSFVRDFSGHSEVSAGGIAGEGSSEAKNAMISNNYATELNFDVGLFQDKDRTKLIKRGSSGGILGMDGNENNAHLIVNTVSITPHPVIGSVARSTFDDTVRIAPSIAFGQFGMLDVLNRNTVHPNNPENVIFTGSFMFADDDRNSDEGIAYPFPMQVAELFEKTIIIEEEVE